MVKKKAKSKLVKKSISKVKPGEQSKKPKILEKIPKKTSSVGTKKKKVDSLITICDLYEEIQEIKRFLGQSPGTGALRFAKSLRELEGVGRRLQNIVTRESGDLIKGIQSDLEQLYGGIAQCAAQIGTAVQSISNRIIDFAKEFERITLDIFSILIEDILSRVGADIKREPKPVLSLLKNPNAALYKGEDPDWKTIDNINDLEPAAHILIHGMGYNDFQEVYDIFIKSFSNATEIFQSGRDTENDMLYLLSWQSDVLAESAALILATLATQGWDVTSSGMQLVLATLIREEERRAAIVAEFMAPFAQSLITGSFPGVSNPQIPSKCFVFSHSYGSYIWAATLHGLQVTGKIPNALTSFGYWYSFQAAVPRDAFAPGKQFSGVGDYFFQISEDRIFFCYFSNSDIILQTAYYWAKGALALGAYGPVGFKGRRRLTDTTIYTKESHGETEFIPTSGGYFKRLDNLIGFRKEEPMETTND